MGGTGQSSGKGRTSVSVATKAQNAPPTSSPPPLTQTPQQQPQQPAQAPAPAPAPAQAPPPQRQGNVDALGFSDYDAADFHQLYNGRGYFQQQKLTAAQQRGMDLYTDPNTEPGSLYNFQQNMNWAITHGGMDSRQQALYDTVTGAMHNLGYNVNLTRYDHGNALDDMLTQAGLRGGHAGMSIAQLKKALVGRGFNDQRILSTSYNDFKNAQDPSVFTTREVKITYKARAGAQAMMPGRGKIPLRGSGMTKGDDFGEMLLAPSNPKTGSNHYRIVDVKYSGSKARPKGGWKGYLPLKQIEIVIEVG